MHDFREGTFAFNSAPRLAPIDHVLQTQNNPRDLGEEMVQERKLIASLKPLKGFRLATVNFAGDDANRITTRSNVGAANFLGVTRGWKAL
jgi:hypothetical protein